MKLSRMLLLQLEGVKSRGCRSRTISHDAAAPTSLNRMHAPIQIAAEEEISKKRKWDEGAAAAASTAVL